MSVTCLCDRDAAVRPAAVADDFELRRDELWEAVRRNNAALAKPLPNCPKCGMLFHPEECGYLRTDRCDSCNTRWLDGIVCRLIRRHGRKATVKILRRLAK
jgi:hypothetical protein